MKSWNRILIVLWDNFNSFWFLFVVVVKFEDLDDKKDEYMSKQGKQTEYIFPKINEDTVVFRKSDKVTKVNI